MSAGAPSPTNPLEVGKIEVSLVGRFWDSRGGRLLVSYLRGAMDVGLARIEAATVIGTPVNTGALRGSFGTKVAERGLIVSGVPAQIVGAVGSPVVYAPHVELGTRGAPRKWPPRAPIEAWVRRRLGSAIDETVAEKAARRGRRLGQRGRRFVRRPEKDRVRTVADLRAREAREGASDREAAIRELTFLVQRKIGRKGTPAIDMLGNALRRERPAVIRTFRSAVARWAREV